MIQNKYFPAIIYDLKPILDKSMKIQIMKNKIRTNSEKSNKL